MNTTQPNTQRVRIYSYMTQSRFLHVEDTLSLGKIRLFVGQYRKGAGMENHLHHYLDIPDARVVLSALCQPAPSFRYLEYKGTPTKQNQAAVSRVLSIAVQENKVYWEVKQGAGRLTPTGAIVPQGKPNVEITVAFTPHAAARLAYTVLAYLQAWEVVRMFKYRHGVTTFPPYELVSTGQEAEAVDTPLAATDLPIEETPSPLPARPVTRRDEMPVSRPPIARSVPRPAFATPSPEAISNKTAPHGPAHLRYGDGTLVDPQNAIERQTYVQYQKVQQQVPLSRLVLQTFYQTQQQASVTG